MSKRKYLPTLAELIDRLSIIQLKEVFITEHKEEYAKEIKDIVYDIDLILKDENVIPERKILEVYKDGNIGNITHLSPTTASGAPTSDRLTYREEVPGSRVEG